MTAIQILIFVLVYILGSFVTSLIIHIIYYASNNQPKTEDDKSMIIFYSAIWPISAPIMILLSVFFFLNVFSGYTIKKTVLLF